LLLLKKIGLLTGSLVFRQDYRINKIFLPFLRPTGQAAERQKDSSLFEGMGVCVN